MLKIKVNISYFTTQIFPSDFHLEISCVFYILTIYIKLYKNT